MDRVYRMVTKDKEGYIVDIREAKASYFWRKNKTMTLGVSKWIAEKLKEGYVVEFHSI